MPPTVEALQPTSQDSPIMGRRTSESNVLARVERTADQHAARQVVTDYLSRKADNTIRQQAADLQRFAAFLDVVGTGSGLELGAALSEFAWAVSAFPTGSPPNPEAWRGVTWGLVEGFRNWMVGEGDAVGRFNVRLSTVKAYAKLAAKAGVLSGNRFPTTRQSQGRRAG